MNKWIKIEDEMPDCDVEVLVWDGNSIEIDYCDSEVDFGTVFFANTHGYTTHWQPLPEPPEAE